MKKIAVKNNWKKKRERERDRVGDGGGSGWGSEDEGWEGKQTFVVISVICVCRLDVCVSFTSRPII